MRNQQPANFPPGRAGGAAPSTSGRRTGGRLVAVAALTGLVAMASVGTAHHLGGVANAQDRTASTPRGGAVFPADSPTGPGRPGTAVFVQATGAARLNASGINGSGVTVAVLDTGIADLGDFSGRLVGGVDLSGEGDPFRDSYGHGTFVAGLIAGNGASSRGIVTGEAPQAGLVAIKVAGRTGITDTATVVTGIDWAVANRAALGIGVLNISMGAMPVGPSASSPLDQAVERAWRSGIVVVVSAGNAGPSSGTILSPGDDPLVITVGAFDDRGTVSVADDAALPFSSVGPTAYDGWLKPDLVTSGRSVLSLRAPGSTVDQNHPTARIGTGNFVGSGTSFSAAITSGAVALILQSSGGRPDDVKARLLATTTAGPSGNIFLDGHGALDAYSATTIPTPRLLAASAAPAPAAAGHSGPSWNGSSWNGSSWNGSSWNGSSWNGSSWNGSSWNGSSWNGSSWNGSSWS